MNTAPSEGSELGARKPQEAITNHYLVQLDSSKVSEVAQSDPGLESKVGAA